MQDLRERTQFHLQKLESALEKEGDKVDSRIQKIASEAHSNMQKLLGEIDAAATPDLMDFSQPEVSFKAVPHKVPEKNTSPTGVEAVDTTEDLQKVFEWCKQLLVSLEAEVDKASQLTSRDLQDLKERCTLAEDSINASIKRAEELFQAQDNPFEVTQGDLSADVAVLKSKVEAIEPVKPEKNSETQPSSEVSEGTMSYLRKGFSSWLGTNTDETSKKDDENKPKFKS